MAEQTQTPPPAGAAPPLARDAEAILADPLVAEAVRSVRDAIAGAREFAGEITLEVERRRIRDVCAAFKRAGFTYCVDVTAVDYSKYPGRKDDRRFAVVYHLYSFEKNDRVRLEVLVADGVKVPSVAPVWKTADWPEREVFDMFGIVFDGHPNLERILMWEGFNGFPLRKDFPLRGVDTGARIYPEVFPEGGGPKAGSTGKDPADVNLYLGEWNAFGVSPTEPAPEPAEAPPAAAATEEPAPPPTYEERLEQLERMVRDLTATVDALRASPPDVPVPRPPIAPPMPPAPMVAPTDEAPREASPATSDAAAPAPDVTGASTADAPWHDETLTIDERLALAKGKGLEAELFAAMAQTDCGACGWDCEGYAEALATGETKELELCVPGAPETTDAVKRLMTEAGKV